MKISNRVLRDDEGICIVDKPTGVSCIRDLTKGLSIQEMLEDHYGSVLYPISRLDKVVRGACIFAKSAKTAKKYSEG